MMFTIQAASVLVHCLLFIASSLVGSSDLAARIGYFEEKWDGNYFACFPRECADGNLWFETVG